MSDGVPFRAHRGGYVTIPNETVNDKRLSFRARGVLLYLLGRPPGWRFAAERVAAEGREGRDAVAAALRELTDLGYYRAVRLRQQDGTFTTATEVSVTPGLMPNLDVSAGHGHNGLSVPGEPPPDKPVSKSVQRATTENQPPPASQGPPSTKPDGDDPTSQAGLRSVASSVDFEQWWTVYPRHTAKIAAEKAYVKARRRVSSQVLLAAAQRFAEDPTREDAFTPHPATWLNRGSWEDEGPVRPEPSRKDSTDVFAAAEARAIEAERRMMTSEPLALTGGTL